MRLCNEKPIICLIIVHVIHLEYAIFFDKVQRVYHNDILNNEMQYTSYYNDMGIIIIP